MSTPLIRPGLSRDVAAFVRRCLSCSNIVEVRAVTDLASLLAPPPGPSAATLAYSARAAARHRVYALRRKARRAERLAERSG